jgi:cysteine-rich repeat protein
MRHAMRRGRPLSLALGLIAWAVSMTPGGIRIAGAQVFAPPVAVTPPDGPSALRAGPDIASAGDAWIATWIDSPLPRGPSCVVSARSGDLGATWTEPAAVGSCQDGANGFVLLDDRVRVAAAGPRAVVVWSRRTVYGARSLDGGATWTATGALVPDEEGHRQRDPHVATDGNGAWLLVWVSRPVANAATGNRIAVSRSTDDGITWGEPVQVHDRGSDEGRFLSKPYVATDGAGRWVVVWIDEPQPPVPPDASAVFASFSADDGASWSAPARIDGGGAPRPGFDVIINVGVTVASDRTGNWVAAWERYQEGRDGIFFTTTFPEVLAATWPGMGGWSSPRVLGREGDGSTRPQVISDRPGRFRVLWAVEYPGDHMRHATSFDGGAAWTPSQRVAERPAFGDPRFATNRAGGLVAIWSERAGVRSARATGACGDGVRDVGEACDDGNRTDGDGCDHTCTPTGCGNGVVTAGETCDPSLDAPVTCCAASCTWASPGAACPGDRTVCTDDVCDGAGACVHPNNTASCDDGDGRTGDDTCIAGVCRGSAAVPRVRIVYLVPADRDENPLYTAALAAAIRHVQLWYRDALGGRTFALADPPVEVARTPHPADWFGSRLPGERYAFVNDVLRDGGAAIGSQGNDVVKYVVDARAPCGQYDSVAGASSARFLDGLAGQDDRPQCAGGAPDRSGACGSAGVLAWSIGVLSGMEPYCSRASASAVSCEDALTGSGLRRYPAARLLPADLDRLAISDLYAPIEGLPGAFPPCACGFAPTQQETCRRTCSPASCDDGDPCTDDVCGAERCEARPVEGSAVLSCAFRRGEAAATHCARDRTGGAILARVEAAGRRLAPDGTAAPPRVVRRAVARLAKAKRLRSRAARRGVLEPQCDSDLRLIIEQALRQLRAWRRGLA